MSKHKMNNKQKERMSGIMKRTPQVQEKTVEVQRLTKQMRETYRRVGQLANIAPTPDSFYKESARLTKLQKQLSVAKEELTNLTARQFYERYLMNVSVRDQNKSRGVGASSPKQQDRQARSEKRLQQRIAKGLPVGDAARDAVKELITV